MKLFKNLFHVTMFVNNIDKSLDYYNKLGFETLFEMSENPGDKAWNYYLRVAHGQYLELQTIEGAAPNPHPAPVSVKKYTDQSLWHFALETDNLKETIKGLIEVGIEVWSDPEKTKRVITIADAIHSPDGCLVSWLVDPDGNFIEIMEQVGETLQRKNDKA